MAKRTKRTLREKASHLNFRVPKNYVDNVVEACIAAKKEPNELGQVGLMLLVNHRFFDFDRRIYDLETSMKRCERGIKKIMELADAVDE